METFVYKDHKKLRCGYTTGTCAALAAQGAVRFLLTGSWRETEELMTPKGIPVRVALEEKTSGDGWAECAVLKDAGDDYDVTNGILVYARAEFPDAETGAADHAVGSFLPQIVIDGGIGIGRVTKPGLDQPVGAAAINSVPRKMIRDAVDALLEEAGEVRSALVTIKIPAGVEAAKKTFNPVLGIEGGISVLGTSGIVEPMSEEALIQTIRVDIKMQLSGGRSYLVLVPGNYGLDFLEDYEPEVLKRSVKYSNFLGEAIDAAVEFGAKGILLVGHIGKLVKLAAGIMNTHSRNADARMDILKEKGLLEPVMKRLMERMEFYVDHRSGKSLERGILTFSLEQGVLGESTDVRRLITCVKAEIEQTESEGTEKLTE